MGNIINHPFILSKNNTSSSLDFPTLKTPNSLSYCTSVPKSSGSSTPTKLGLAIINSLSYESKTFEESTLVDSPKYNNEGTFFVPQFKINVPTLSLYYCPKETTKPINVAPKEIIEMSEDYTRITFHCPKSETTHIFGDCILECHPKEFVFPVGSIYNGEIIRTQAYEAASYYDGSASTSVTPIFESGFLKTCFACNKSLDGDDIYIYRGDASFCSIECRFEEIMGDKHNEAMRKKMEKLVKKKKNNEDISSKKIIFLVGEMALGEM